MFTWLSPMAWVCQQAATTIWKQVVMASPEKIDKLNNTFTDNTSLLSPSRRLPEFDLRFLCLSYCPFVLSFYLLPFLLHSSLASRPSLSLSFPICQSYHFWCVIVIFILSFLLIPVVLLFPPLSLSLLPFISALLCFSILLSSSFLPFQLYCHFPVVISLASSHYTRLLLHLSFSSSLFSFIHFPVQFCFLPQIIIRNVVLLKACILLNDCFAGIFCIYFYPQRMRPRLARVM